MLEGQLGQMIRACGGGGAASSKTLKQTWQKRSRCSLSKQSVQSRRKTPVLLTVWMNDGSVSRHTTHSRRFCSGFMAKLTRLRTLYLNGNPKREREMKEAFVFSECSRYWARMRLVQNCILLEVKTYIGD